MVALCIHLKLIRCNEDENDLERSLQVEDEKIVLVKLSASTLQCSLCPNKYQGSLSVTEHVINVHKLAHNRADDKQLEGASSWSVIVFLFCENWLRNADFDKIFHD